MLIEPVPTEPVPTGNTAIAWQCPPRKAYTGITLVVRLLVLPCEIDGRARAFLRSIGSPPPRKPHNPRLVYDLPMEGLDRWLEGAVTVPLLRGEAAVARELCAVPIQDRYCINGLSTPADYMELERIQQAAGLPTGGARHGGPKAGRAVLDDEQGGATLPPWL